MTFKCGDISIDDGEFGCTITFSEFSEESNHIANRTTSTDILESIERYILIQRTYPEDEFENDYYYFESSDFEKSGELTDFEIELSRTKFRLISKNENCEIYLETDETTHHEIKDVLEVMTQKTGRLKIIE